jgi:hypothetical protein
MTDLNEVKLEALLDIINSSARQAIAEYKKTGHRVPGPDSTTFHPLDLATDTLGLKKAIRLLEGAYHQLSAILAPLREGKKSHLLQSSTVFSGFINR